MSLHTGMSNMGRTNRLEDYSLLMARVSAAIAASYVVHSLEGPAWSILESRCEDEEDYKPLMVAVQG